MPHHKQNVSVRLGIVMAEGLKCDPMICTQWYTNLVYTYIRPTSSLYPNLKTNYFYFIFPNTIVVIISCRFGLMGRSGIISALIILPVFIGIFLRTLVAFRHFYANFEANLLGRYTLRVLVDSERNLSRIGSTQPSRFGHRLPIPKINNKQLKPLPSHDQGRFRGAQHGIFTGSWNLILA